MMPRFLSATPDAQLIPLPWSTPLERWPKEHLVALPRGISRHVVRFIRVGSNVYAAKEVNEELALHEYRLLHDLRRKNTPSVEAIGVVTGRLSDEGIPLDPILLTRHLQFALPYRSLFAPGVRHDTVMRLLDAMVVLIARLHLIGLMWKDVSLSNILFRRDAGSFAAYLVDAETGELHDRLTDGQRGHDIEIARVNIFGDFSDLQAGDMLDPSLDPMSLVDTIASRYHELWQELTGAEEFQGSELHRIERRVRRLNALGFDVAELDIDTVGDVVKIQPKVVDAGHHSRRLLRLTGLDTEENQARRLLNDMDTYLAATNRSDLEESVAAHAWLTECFEPVISAVPMDLQGKRDPAQLYHEVLDYRWYASQRENRDVGLFDATHGYINDVLAKLPDEAMPTAKPLDELTEEMPVIHDPWEDQEVDITGLDRLDIAALRAKAKNKA